MFENIYMNSDEVLETKRPEASFSDKGKRKRRYSGATPCFMLLGLLLVGTIALSVTLIIKERSGWTSKVTQMKNEYSNLTEKSDQLQEQFNALIKYMNCDSHCHGLAMRGNSCYFVSTEQKTWEESRQDCLLRGADLVVINCKEEQEFLIKINKRAWIGLSDREQEGVWKWVDSTQLDTPSYWYSPQPDNGGPGASRAEDCVEMYPLNQDPLKKWNDLTCSSKNYWICEMQV